MIGDFGDMAHWYWKRETAYSPFALLLFCLSAENRLLYFITTWAGFSGSASGADNGDCHALSAMSACGHFLMLVIGSWNPSRWMLCKHRQSKMSIDLFLHPENHNLTSSYKTRRLWGKHLDWCVILMNYPQKPEALVPQRSSGRKSIQQTPSAYHVSLFRSMKPEHKLDFCVPLYFLTQMTFLLRCTCFNGSSTARGQDNCWLLPIAADY